MSKVKLLAMDANYEKIERGVNWGRTRIDIDIAYVDIDNGIWNCRQISQWVNRNVEPISFYGTSFNQHNINPIHAFTPFYIFNGVFYADLEPGHITNVNIPGELEYIYENSYSENYGFFDKFAYDEKKRHHIRAISSLHLYDDITVVDEDVVRFLKVSLSKEKFGKLPSYMQLMTI